jgi:hypothetical protein
MVEFNVLDLNPGQPQDVEVIAPQDMVAQHGNELAEEEIITLEVAPCQNIGPNGGQAAVTITINMPHGDSA